MVDCTDNNKDQDSENSTNYFFFLIITTLYAMVKYNISSDQHAMATMCYVLTVIVGEFMLNLNASKRKCKGHQNWQLAFMVTVIPWILMFSIIMIMLRIYPGWISPFSNTIGYGIAHLAGSHRILNKIFPPNPTEEETKAASSEELNEIKQSLAYIYSDQSVLMNEVTVDNFSEFWNRTKPLRSDISEQFKEQFRKIIQLKTIVGEYIWYLLTGSLVVSVSHTYMFQSKCNFTAKQIKESEAQCEKEAKKKEKKNQT